MAEIRRKYFVLSSTRYGCTSFKAYACKREIPNKSIKRQRLHEQKYSEKYDNKRARKQIAGKITTPVENIVEATFASGIFVTFRRTNGTASKQFVEWAKLADAINIT